MLYFRCIVPLLTMLNLLQGRQQNRSLCKEASKGKIKVISIATGSGTTDLMTELSHPEISILIQANKRYPKTAPNPSVSPKYFCQAFSFARVQWLAAMLVTDEAKVQYTTSLY